MYGNKVFHSSGSSDGTIPVLQVFCIASDILVSSEMEVFKINDVNESKLK